MVIRTVLALCMVLLFVDCKTNEYDPSRPPEGFANNMGLKVAYTLGTIEPTLTKVTIPKNIEVHKDIVYKIIDTTALKLDIYSPKALKNEAPLIIFIHGGAWEKGKKSNVLHYLISYANKGYITARCSHIFNIIQIYSLKNI